MIFDYRGTIYPEYLKHGNACEHIAASAKHFCRGLGLDIGGGQWPLPGAIVVDIKTGGDALRLPEKKFAYVFSSHCLEHLDDPIRALEHWKSRIEPGGVMFLYLPHPDQIYWRPQWNRKHRHSWRPEDIEQILRDLGFVNVIRSERDLYWSFAVVGFVPGESPGTLDPMDRFKMLIENADEYFRADPQMLSIFKTFGAEAFRRSSMFDGLEDFIRAQNFRGKRCVEIGTYSGITAIILSRYFEEVMSIDIFPHTAKHTIVQHCGIRNIRFIDVKDNAEKARVVASLGPFDAAYQDGDHLHDTETDFALLKPCGRILFHEYYEQQPPVFDLVNRLKLTGSVVTDGRKLALWTAR